MSVSVSHLVDWLGLSNISPQVKPTTLPVSYFKFPPAPEPITVPPPPSPYHEPSLARPFTIPAEVYNGLLKPQVPITVALVYMSLVSVLNQANANRSHKPWAISRTRTFKLLVIFHNVFLAVYSAWTCAGMVNALVQSLPEIDEDWKVSKTVDALCKLHGPRGAGSAATYNATSSAWEMTNRLLHLTADGLGPETSDAGRIWNEGLAFYGWLFYLSKFYEVVDTLIILLKGRRSSLLQTYHHAGAMISMWAGIRYMSPPIWMFVLVNSGIHAVMYTFYLLSALGIKVPKWFKQTLTTIQITQFVVGATYAFLHLFIAYQIPISVPYLYHLGGVASKVVADAPTEVTSSVATAISTGAGYGAWLKKAVLRGAGYEGLAENVLNEQGRPFGVDAVHIVEDAVRREETRYRDEMQWNHCLDTSGQVFAILLNCVYLLPLTWLFLQFFITSYVKQFERRRSRTASDAAIVAGNSFLDASKGVTRRLNEAVQEMHNITEEIGDDTVFVDGEEIKREMKEAAEQAKNAIQRGNEKIRQAAKDSGLDPEAVKQGFQRDMEAARKTLQDAAVKVKDVASQAADPESREKIIAKAQSLKENTGEAVEKIIENVKAMAGSAQEQAEPAVNYASDKADELKDQAGPTVEAAAEKAAESKDRAVETFKSTTGQASEATPEPADHPKESKKSNKKAKDTTQKTAAKAKESVAKTGNESKDTAQKSADKTKENAKKVKGQAKEAAQKSKDTGETTAAEAQSKANDLSEKVEDTTSKKAASKGEEAKPIADTATSESQSPSQSQSESNQQSPNGNGTSADAVSGQNNEQQSTSTKTTEETKSESEQAIVEKKEEDKIIDESQEVRDEDIDATAAATSTTETNGRDGKGEGEGDSEKPSFADVVKKDDGEDKDDKEKEGWGI